MAVVQDTSAAQMPIRLGREIAGDLEVAEQREWLVTNGIGGYGSGTIAGSITRGYHGLLVAALAPPVDRRLMLVKLDETLTYRGAAYDLATNRWASGAVAPAGYTNIESFELEGSVPLWRFACAEAVVEKRIWMKFGANTTFVSYTLVSAADAVTLSIRAIVDNRVFHNTGQVAWPAQVEPTDDGLRVTSGGDGSRPLVLLTDSGDAQVTNELYRGYYLPQETARGLNDHDDHVHAGTFEATIAPGETLLFLASADDDAAVGDGELEERRERDAMLLARFDAARPSGAGESPPWIQRLVLAADQFVVDRPTVAEPDGQSVIAGYHWFEDWGRDTMISLPGLALVTGRSEVAGPILEAFSQYVSQGMLPNRFPDGSDQPEYNTIDATLWYFQAIRAYLQATADAALLRKLWPTLQEIVDAHVAGTRYGIVVDPADGLLRGGEPGVQLTWMDAKVGDHVITPRIGKPVEVNALWYNALAAMVSFADRLGEPSAPYQARAEAALEGFERFWNPAAGYCYDVLDGPDGDDPSLRPNQLLAVSLPDALLDEERRRAVFDVCAHAFLGSHGIRSLAASDPAFVGFYGGDQAHRDGAYHEGTVWAWLIGPFVDAHLRVHGDPAAAQRILAPFADHLAAAGLGTISEIFDGDAPFTPRGCIAQAWSVGEVLRAFHATESRPEHQ
ncbi:MAG TPA: amylo-alpha-1,6-glucosidase [Solirubrobacteraceae bacterium]